MKKKSLLTLFGLTTLASVVTLALVSNNNLNFSARATETEYTITLNKNNKLGSNSKRGTGTAYTGYENPIDIYYDDANWDSKVDDDFVTFNADGDGLLYNKTAISGIKRIDVRAKQKSSGASPKLKIILSVGQYDYRNDGQTSYSTSVYADFSTSYKTFSVIPTSQDYSCNYFRLEGDTSPLLSNSSISIESITVTYSCSMSKVALRIWGNSTYSFAKTYINGVESTYGEFTPYETAQVSVTYDTDEYDFVGWRYNDSYDIISDQATFNYTLDTSTGFHNLVPHFVKRNCINVYSNHSSLGDAAFSDKDNAKYAYTNTEYTVVATLVESNLEEGFFPAFGGWYLDGVKVSDSLTYTFTVPVEGEEYEMVAHFGIYNESFNSAVRLCATGNYGIPYDLDTDSFVKSYDGSYYGFDSYINTWDGPNKGDCQEFNPGHHKIWQQNARGISALSPYLVLNKNHSNYHKRKPEGGYEAAPIKDFDPAKVGCIELIFDKSSDSARDDLSISGGATEFALTQKGIIDPVDGNMISKFYITNFTKDDIKISIPDRLSGDNYFKIKRVVVHYKVEIPQLEQ